MQTSGPPNRFVRTAVVSGLMSGLHPTIAIVGLGYVGLPLAVAFSRHHDTIGYDTEQNTINALKQHRDPSGSFDPGVLQSLQRLRFTSDARHIGSADYVIVCVPTPVDQVNMPDLDALRAASTTIGKHMQRGVTVIYESTVYPGATETVCIPILERTAGMQWPRDFRVGYSPERINPGDSEHVLENVVKVVAGDGPDTLAACAELYETIIPAGVHRARSIMVAETAKLIENSQRDLNIALMNELSIILGKLGIDTQEVLAAAATKWNFMPFKPGLVGGHCIGVDPYYLAYKAERVGYHPQIILAGRRINDGMVSYIAKLSVQALIRQGSCVSGDTVVVLGSTFKEDCVDVRNAKVHDLCRYLRDFSLNPVLHDPIADPHEVRARYGVELLQWEALPRNASALILAVPHRYYQSLPLPTLLSPLRERGVFVDVKSSRDPEPIRALGHDVVRL